MAWLTRSSKFTLLMVALAFTLAVNLPAQVQAQASFSLGRELIEKIPNHWELSDYHPPSDGENGTPSDVGRPGGTRSPNCPKPKLKNPPVALVPSSRMGTTVAEYPTFSWYMPSMESAGLDLKFVLKDADGKELYSVNYPLPDQVNAGIRSITLPPFVNLPPLEVNQKYDWQVGLIDPGCSLNNIYIDGGVKRVEEAPKLVQRIKQATPQQRVAIYVNDRLWYETLTTLVELRRQSPNDENLKEALHKLLTSVGLDPIAKKPLFEQASRTNN